MLSLKAFRCLLHLYPGEFQEEYGRELDLVFRDRMRESGSWLERLFRSGRGGQRVGSELLPLNHAAILNSTEKSRRA